MAKKTLESLVEEGDDALDSLIDSLSAKEEEGILAQDILDAIFSEIEE